MSLAGGAQAARRSLPVLAGGAGASLAATAAIHDGLARRIRYLRVSLTDRCNYRCTYCMPPQGVALLPRPDLLSFEEIAEIVEALAACGVRSVRLTGGEPTVRKDLVELVGRLSALGLDDLSLSTNGERLVELAGPLRRAGLHRLNVSLDTLKEDRFQLVTRKGHLPAVLAGLDAARAAGFAHTKLNTVAMRGFNDDELGAICRYAFERGFTPRFIELMPMAEGQLFYPGSFLPAARVRELLAEELGPLRGDGAEGRLPGVGPARYAQVSFRGEARRVGIISAVTEPFCDTCNRVRLSATGQLHSCLGRDESTDLRGLCRGGLPRAERQAGIVAAVRQAARDKQAGHEFTPAGCGGPKKYMVSIGG